MDFIGQPLAPGTQNAPQRALSGHPRIVVFSTRAFADVPFPLLLTHATVFHLPALMAEDSAFRGALERFKRDHLRGKERSSSGGRT